MFFVSDTEAHKRRRIVEFGRREPMIAVLLAAANFEWTVGRCILFFGNSPNIRIRKGLENTYGLKRYADLWGAEICQYDSSAPPLNEVVQNWVQFREAFQMRHRLCLRARGRCPGRMWILERPRSGGADLGIRVDDHGSCKDPSIRMQRVPHGQHNQ